MRGLPWAVLLVCAVSGVAEGQQSVRGAGAVVPTAREIEEARVATGMKCLSTGAFAAQTLNSREEPRTVPARRTTRGGLGLGALDASEGMSRPPMSPQLHILEGDIDQRGQRSFRGAMVARQEVEPYCTPVAPKARGVDSTGAPPSPR